MMLAPNTPPLRLDLGCGNNPREGFEGVDKFAPNAKHKVDLFKFPWPWADNSVDELHASHFLEHIPAREVDCGDVHPDWISSVGKGKDPELRERMARFQDRDMLCCFMDEAWRVLKPHNPSNGSQGTFTVIVPNARNNRAFQDPTHRRFFVAESFYYFAKDWRKQQGLDHYLCNCDFGIEVNHTMPSELGLLHPEAQARRFNESWNVIFDWHARLTAKKC
jgi:hypothetical protein